MLSVAISYDEHPALIRIISNKESLDVLRRLSIELLKKADVSLDGMFLVVAADVTRLTYRR